MSVQIEKWDFFELTLQGQAAGNLFVDDLVETDFT